ncbi:MAG: AMP-binding protein [Lentimicrobiaceae bacterium]|nr:AMP-binding protein [Lentimicrobiaceae bacterium]MCO5265228.1 AMP-binding protein [Lentimicrobium sp.]HPG32648.1 AMP-binding protein [Lentimicrobium sp.]
MFDIPDKLILNGQTYKGKTLLQLAADLQAKEKTEQEKSLGKFISHWVDKQDFVKVKTSGSTGKPKIIKLKKSALLASASMTTGFLRLNSGQTALLCLNTHFIAGIMMVVRAMQMELNLITVAPDGFPLNNLPDNQPVDFAAMVPAQVFNSINHPASRRKLESIGTLIIGGAPISPSLEESIAGLSGKIYATFGMTETISHIALRRINGPERKETYTLLPDITMETDERGCLIACVPYLDESRIVTNDLIRIETPTTFQWLGRADNVINSGGLKLIPEEIEKKITPFLTSRFFIAAQPDTKLGEIPVLIIESATPVSASEKEALLSRIKTVLAKSELPKYIWQSSQFAETSNGKINRSKSVENLQAR